MSSRSTSRTKHVSATPTSRSPRPRRSSAGRRATEPLSLRAAWEGWLALVTLAFALLLISAPARAALLRHQILEDDSDESMQTGRVCYALKTLKNGRLLCLPTPSLIDDPGHLGVHLAIKANEQAYGIATHALSGNIDKPFLDTLFGQENFQSVSGYAQLRAAYAGTTLTFTPLHVLGAFKLTNPSLPEVHVAGVKESVLRLSQELLLRNFPGSSYGEILLVPSVYGYQRTFAYLDADALTASVAKVTSLVEKRSVSGVDGDVALSLLAKRPGRPSVTVRVNNVADAGACANCADRYMNIERTFGTTASVSSSIYFNHPVGQSLLGVNFPYYGPFKTYDILQTTGTYVYKLSRLECFASFSPVIYTFGFLFEADVYRLGVLYSDEKQDNTLQINRQKQTYVFSSFYL